MAGAPLEEGAGARSLPDARVAVWRPASHHLAARLGGAVRGVGRLGEALALAGVLAPCRRVLALLQALWPLQAFEAPHFTPAAKDVDAKLVAAKTETAVAISIRLFMEILLVGAGNRARMRSFAALGLRRYRPRMDLLV